MGRCGPACDNTLSYDVVTAAGKMVTASASENPDLFWALNTVISGWPSARAHAAQLGVELLFLAGHYIERHGVNDQLSILGQLEPQVLVLLAQLQKLIVGHRTGRQSSWRYLSSMSIGMELISFLHDTRTSGASPRKACRKIKGISM